MHEYRGLVRYYTNKNIGVSYLRAKKKNDQTARAVALRHSPANAIGNHKSFGLCY